MKGHKMHAKDLYTRSDGKFQEISGGYSGIIEPGVLYCYEDGYARWTKNHHRFEYNVLAIHPEYVILDVSRRGIRVKADDCNIVPVELREEVLIFVDQFTNCDAEILDDDMKKIVSTRERGHWRDFARKERYWANRPPTHWATGTYRKDGDVWRRIAHNYDSSG